MMGRWWFGLPSQDQPSRTKVSFRKPKAKEFSFLQVYRSTNKTTIPSLWTSLSMWRTFIQSTLTKVSAWKNQLTTRRGFPALNWKPPICLSEHPPGRWKSPEFSPKYNKQRSNPRSCGGKQTSSWCQGPFWGQAPIPRYPAREQTQSSHQGLMIMTAHQKINLNQKSIINPIVWSSKTIQKVAVSTLSAEAMALAGAMDILAWRRLYLDTRFKRKK